MDFDFSDDQEQLRDAVRKWVDKGYTFERRRAAVAAGGFDRAAWNELAELGLTALTVPEAHDGMGQGAIDAMVVAEELGRGIVLEPIAQAFIASAVLSHYAPAEVQSAWLPRVASGEAVVVLAHQERKARYRLDVCEAKAAPAQSGYAVTAIKSVVPAGDKADAFIVPAQLDGKIALFLVERTASGVTTPGLRHARRQPRRRSAPGQRPRHAHHHRRPGRAGTGRGHRHCRHLRRSRGRDGQNAGASPSNT
jgi:alkylation response protein AidB-like acyl-CoA dehydrogenase